jgi:DNA modification methylase
VIIRADARQIPLVDGCVQTCVTSPPYFGLRDYGTARWEGGDAGCDHKKLSQGRPTWGAGSTQSSTLSGKPTNDNHDKEAHYKDTCGKCGATRIDAQIGLEPTPDAYVASLVAVFAEVWRVLRDDGTVWINIGDSYASSGPASGAGKQHTNVGSVNGPVRYAPPGLKPKDLIGIPWRVALALQAAGWYLRSDIIWHKLNPMPESVTDRPTKAHEYIFLLSKSSTYYYDAAAIAEPVACSEAVQRVKNRARNEQRGKGDQAGVYHARGVAAPFSNWKDTRNKRSVWTIPTKPFKGAHFATFPPALVETCLLAGARPGDVVLDPFCGSGTVGLVARQYAMRFVGCDLNAQYTRMAHARVST